MADPAPPLAFARFTEADWPAVWACLRPAFAAGDSYPCPIDMDEAAARAYWIDTPFRTYVTRLADGALAGTFYIRPDQAALGDHVCNCGYVVAEDAGGRGVATALRRWSQEEARRLGFLAMKFNLVVAANAPAIRAWTKAGMAIIGTAPKAFRHKDLGLVDAHIMYKWLGD